MDPDPAVADEVESNAPAPAEGAAPTENPPPTVGQGGGERGQEAFLQMMSAWYTEFVRTNLNAQPPSSPDSSTCTSNALRYGSDEISQNSSW